MPKYKTLKELKDVVNAPGGHGIVEGLLEIGTSKSIVKSAYNGDIIYEGPGSRALLYEALDLLGIPYKRSDKDQPN